MKSGPLDQTRFKSGHQISQTSRLKRRVDLDRRIFCTTNLSYTSSLGDILPIYRKYRRYIADIFDISAIYLPEKTKKFPTLACLPSADISVRIRYFVEILPTFSDFSRFFLQTIFCIKNRFDKARYLIYRRYIGRYIGNFNPLSYYHMPFRTHNLS